MKKRKIKWGNVIKLIILIGCTVLILHDYYLIIFKLGMFTWFGVATHIFWWIIVYSILEDFEEQIEKMPAKKGSQHLK